MKRMRRKSVLLPSVKSVMGPDHANQALSAPGRLVRVQIAVLGLALVIGVAACGDDEVSDLFTTPAADLIGNWENVDPETRGISRVSIREEAGSLLVHVWGSCEPEECDWGEAKASKAPSDSEGTAIAVTWDSGYATHSQTLVLNPNGQLKVTTTAHYTDDSGRSDSAVVDLFLRQ